MIIKSYSKINLTLKVNSKSRNGLHEIQTLYSWINLIDQSNADERLGGSIASALYCYQKGVDIFRVHDVKETSQSLKIFKKLCLK